MKKLVLLFALLGVMAQADCVVQIVTIDGETHTVVTCTED